MTDTWVIERYKQVLTGFLLAGPDFVAAVLEGLLSSEGSSQSITIVVTSLPSTVAAMSKAFPPLASWYINPLLVTPPLIIAGTYHSIALAVYLGSKVVIPISCSLLLTLKNHHPILKPGMCSSRCVPQEMVAVAASQLKTGWHKGCSPPLLLITGLEVLLVYFEHQTHFQPSHFSLHQNNLWYLPYLALLSNESIELLKKIFPEKLMK